MKKFMTLLAIPLSLLMLLSACTGNSDSGALGSTPASGNYEGKSDSKITSGDVVELNLGVWSDDETKRLVVAFEGIEEELGIKINVMKYPSDSDFWDNIPGQIAAGTAPDIIACSNEHYLQYIKEGLFEPLDSAIEDGTINIDGILPSALSAWQIDGKTYGVPYALNPGVFIVNNDMWNEMGFQKYPDTWDDVLDICAQYKEKTGEPALCINVQEYHLTNYAISFGGGWGFGKSINSAENAAAMQFILDAYSKGYVITPTELGLGWDGAVMIQESALFSTGGAWYQPSFASEAPDIELKYLPVPVGGGSKGGLTLHSGALVALKNSKHPVEVSKAIGYAFANEGLFKATVEVTEVVPANGAYYDLYRQKLPALADLVDYIDKGQPFAYPVRSKEFADALIEAMQSAMFDESSTVTGKEIVDGLATKFSS